MRGFTGHSSRRQGDVVRLRRQCGPPRRVVNLRVGDLPWRSTLAIYPCRAKRKCYQSGNHRAINPVTRESIVDDAG